MPIPRPSLASQQLFFCTFVLPTPRQSLTSWPCFFVCAEDSIEQAALRLGFLIFILFLFDFVRQSQRLCRARGSTLWFSYFLCSKVIGKIKKTLCYSLITLTHEHTYIHTYTYRHTYMQRTHIDTHTYEACQLSKATKKNNKTKTYKTIALLQKATKTNALSVFMYKRQQQRKGPVCVKNSKVKNKMSCLSSF